MVRLTGRSDGVPPPRIDAVTPEPTNVTAVAPSRFVPLIVALTVVPAAPVRGRIPPMVGPVWARTRNRCAVEVPPPGLNTVKPRTRDWVIVDEGIVACNCVALTKVVGRSTAFERTTEPATNPEPVRVTMTSGDPHPIRSGVMDRRVGPASPDVTRKPVNSLDVPDALERVTVRIPS